MEASFGLLSPTFFAPQPVLSLGVASPTQVRVTWSPMNPCDRLRSAPSATGLWTDLPGASSGQLLPMATTMQYFRVAQ